MNLITCRNSWVILTAFLFAFLLSIMPMPIWARNFRPQWVTLMIIYWCLAVPQRVNIGSAWTFGIIQDVLSGTLLGQRALALSIVAFATIKLHLRIRIFPLWQQSLAVFLLLLLDRLLDLWVIGVTDQPIPNLWYWVPAFTSTLLWPWLYIILRDLRQRFNIE